MYIPKECNISTQMYIPSHICTQINHTLATIPKILHLYWDGSPMSFLQLLTVITFNHYNSNWSIYLWMPEKRFTDKTRKGDDNKGEYMGKDYFGELMNIPNISIKKLNFDKIGFFDNVSEVDKSDYLRYWALNKYGGIYADFDIVFIKPIFECFKYVNLKEEMEAATVMYKNKEECVFPVGFLMGKPNNKFFKHILDNVNKYYNRDQCESIGGTLFKKLFQNIEQLEKEYPDVVVLKQSSYLPYLWFEANEIFDTSDNKICDDTIGIHWFNGATYSKTIQNLLGDIDKLNYTPKGIIFQYIEKFIANYKKYSSNNYYDYKDILRNMTIITTRPTRPTQ